MFAGTRMISSGILLASVMLSMATAEAQQHPNRPTDPYVGITSDGEIEGGLFSIRKTGVSTEPVMTAARGFLGALSESQRERVRFPVDDPEWRKWKNTSSYDRQGVAFDELDDAQREAAFGLLRASLSAKGLELSRNIMRLNHTLAELNDDNFERYGEWLYWLTVMGEPSATEPWGWQLDGHHLIINYFVLGDQVVMTPTFVGSEPVVAESGKYAGISIMQQEQDHGLAMLLALDEKQRAAAILQPEKAGVNNIAEAFRDNFDLSPQGISAAAFSDDQKRRLLDLVSLYVGNLADGHAAVKMHEVTAHIDDTYFAWIGGDTDDAVFYYRIHSPVILIEFDHQRPANLRHLYPPVPYREHIHAVIRTPNGNDYGKDLLRQHYAQRHDSDR